MSATASHIQSMVHPAPLRQNHRAHGAEADVALILAAHGSRRSDALRAMSAHALDITRRGPFAEVYVAALFGGGATPVEVMRRVRASRAVVVPVMMCDGETAREVLPRAFALASADRGSPPPTLTFCPPIGGHPALTHLIVTRAHTVAVANGWQPAATTLLLIGHGSSRRSASFETTNGHAGRLRRLNAFPRIATAFLEQEPRLDGCLAAVEGPVVAVGLFAGAGQHAAVDVEAAISRSQRTDIAYAGPIGDDPAITDIILAVADTPVGAPASLPPPR